MLFSDESRFDYDGRGDTNGIEQLADVFILQRHTAPCPIALRAVAVNVDVAAQVRVCGGAFFALSARVIASYWARVIKASRKPLSACAVFG